MRLPTPQPAKERPPLPKEYFWREHRCPFSGQLFDSVAVKANAYTVRSRDPDFRPHYEGVNPLHYAVVVSPAGLAAEESVFKRSPELLFKDRGALLELMQAHVTEDGFCGLRDLAKVSRAYELALACAAQLRIPRAEVAGLALRASWINMEWAEEGYAPAAEQALALRRIALETYLVAYEKEDVTKLKLGSAGVAYLIAELLREQRRYDESLRWFSRIVTDKTAGAEVLRNARNQMELCRSQRQRAKDSGEYEKPALERTIERSMYQLYRDQARWLTRVAGEVALTESEVLRAAIDGIVKSKLDLSRFKSEADLAAWIAQRLKEDA